MAELKKEVIQEVPKPAAPSEEELVYVSIPAVDTFDQPHSGVRLIGGSIKELRNGVWVDSGVGGSNLKFEAGKTYQVPAFVAREVERILAVAHREEIRLLRPRADSRSVSQVNAGSMWARGAGFTLDGGDKALAEKVAGKGEHVITQKWD